MTVAVARSSASRGPGGLPAGSLGMFSLSSKHSYALRLPDEGAGRQGRQKRASALRLNRCSLGSLLQSMSLRWRNESSRRPWEPSLSS